MADRADDLGAEQVRIVAEVALERVAVDDDVVGIDVAGHRPADVLAVGVELLAPVGDRDRGRREQLLELRRQLVERLDDELVELARRLIGRRQRGEGVAAVDEPAELVLGHLLAGQLRRQPRGDDDDHGGAGDDRDETREAVERRRPEQEESDRGDQRRPAGGAQRWSEDFPHRGEG